MFSRVVIPIVIGVALLTPALAQQDGPRPVGQTDSTNLPVQKLGKEDLLNVQIYDAPQLGRTVRILPDGTIRLPMLKQALRVEGLFPADVEILVADEFRREELLVDPFVTVQVAEYHSRPIGVNGAVKNPTVFQAIGNVDLLAAIAKAGGLTAEAGGDIIITRSNAETGQSVQRIPVKPLIDGADPTLNVTLVGGEEIRVPSVGTVVVTGNVRESGIYPVQDTGTTTVMTAIAQAKGVGDFSPKLVYIYRKDAQGVAHETEVDLSAIKKRTRPDVVLQAKDVLYVPENGRAKLTDKMITALTGVGAASATALVYTRR
ncbi:MAG: polysaccharide biosynthesis/export family protein [Acidobacteriota bacterium]|nr:polysaccharide biosynthesis/export family protein [Acidobacteriota bacterium]